MFLARHTKPVYVIGGATWVANTENYKIQNTMPGHGFLDGKYSRAMRPIPNWADRHTFVCDRFGPMGHKHYKPAVEDTMHMCTASRMAGRGDAADSKMY